MYTFEIGMEVTFAQPSCAGDPIAYAINRYGMGPFRIIAVRDVSKKCTCGGSLSDRDHTSEGGDNGAVCPFGDRPLSDSVGHSQWLGITDGNGAIIGAGDSTAPLKWSGWYFVPVSPGD